MSDRCLKLASEFPVPDRAQWLALVDKALKGAPFDKKLLSRLYEGIVVQPLYTAKDFAADGDPSGFPGATPFLRGGRAGGAGADGWTIRTDHAAALPADANAAILDDLLRGANAIQLRFDRATRQGRFAQAAARGDDGIAIQDEADLDRVLKDVLLDLAPVSLDAGIGAIDAAAALAALWRRRGVGPDQARGGFGIDPLGTLAAEGVAFAPLAECLDRMAEVAAVTHRDWPRVRAVAVDTTAWHEAGATVSQELAVALATGATYLKALTAAGLDIADALAQIAFTLPVDCDQFLSIAKLRAARWMWARVAEACGAPETARRMDLTARTSRRMMSRRDPWVNLLRTTVAGFAGGVGGADSVVVVPFDAELGPSDPFARRLARNIQILLKEESSLDRVIDPAGGSWYVETLTRQLAEAAWSEFQAIEAAGGMVAVLEDGSLAARVAAAWAERAQAIARRKTPLTGISEFPNLHEAPVERPSPDLTALRAEVARRAAGLEAPVPVVSRPPLPRHRLGEAFEALRDAATAFRARTGAWPRLFLANFGPVAKHTARATYAKNYFEAGGIETVGSGGFTTAEEAGAAFTASGAKLVCLCGGDSCYGEGRAEAFAQALKQAGAELVYLAGNPGDNKAAWQAAGVDEFIFVGCDVLATLRTAHTRLGVCA